MNDALVSERVSLRSDIHATVNNTTEKPSPHINNCLLFIFMLVLL